MQTLEEWFLENKRDFPWRKDPSPYKVFVSEVMLQQTRASVVITYFEKWMKLFPDLEALAKASLDEVMKAWEGLGYYRRVKNLHKAAQTIVQNFSAKIPSSKEELLSIQGLGPYTVGAILSFGFQQKALAIDGNVMRVIARLFCIEENIDKQKTKKAIETKVESLLDPKRPWISAEALIELGATVCTPKKPLCEICPLQASCQGKEKKELLPIKNERKQTVFLQRWVLLLCYKEKVLIKKEEEGKVMGGLYQFPFFKKEKTKVEKLLFASFGIKARLQKRMPPVKHSFTHFLATLFPLEFELLFFQEIPGYEWVDKKSLASYAFSSGHRKILVLWQ